MATPVSLREVEIAYGRHRVVANLDLEVPAGEFLVLLGPSGCGKSTLLNAIAGLTELSTGEIWIAGTNVTWAEPKDRGIGMVFQSYALYPQMTVAQNLGFGLKVARVPRAEIARRVARTAALLQLTPLLDRKPAALSGGQRQRVAIGRALMRDVEVFLFDEPLSNLDAKLRAELRVEIKKLHLEIGSTMIYVTHDQVEAMTLADRIAIMRDGVIQQLGSPQEIYHRPANLFVAGFVGAPAMNLIDGHIRHEAGRTRFACDGIAADVNGAALAAGPVTAGLRPEQIVIGGGAGLAMLEARVTLVEAMGPDTVVWCRAGAQALSVRTTAAFAGRPGDVVPLGLDLAAASFFDPESGARL